MLVVVVEDEHPHQGEAGEHSEGRFRPPGFEQDDAEVAAYRDAQRHEQVQPAPPALLMSERPGGQDEVLALGLLPHGHARGRLCFHRR